MEYRDLNDERSSADQPHALAREQFPAYVAAVARGGAPPAHAAMSAHVAACAACRAELDELLAMTRLAYDGQFAAAPAYPAADLSFLRPAPFPRVRDHMWRIDHLGRLTIQFSDALVAALAPRAATGAARGQFLFRYVQDPSTVDDLGVTIDVFAEDVAHNQARVRVGVDVPSRNALDQSGSQVVVRVGEAVWQGETDESGSVDLAPIPLVAINQMQIEITPSRN